MNEIEVKILEVDVPGLEKKLIELGGKKVFDGQITSVAFDFPDRRFSDDEILIRLRKKGNESELTVKKLVETKQSKISIEDEVIVSDFETMEKILQTIGLQKKNKPLTKHRMSYLLDNVHFEFDTYPQFPTYLEIEAPSNEAIAEYAQKLGLSVSDLKPWGVREVFAYYRNK
jgi:adenylate cyclase class 2